MHTPPFVEWAIGFYTLSVANRSMAFIRLKPHHRKRYAYLVSSVWDANKQMAAQKVLAYLGQVMQSPAANHTFVPPYPKTYAEMIKALIAHQCRRFGLENGSLKRYAASGPIRKLVVFRINASNVPIERFAALYRQSGFPKETEIVIGLYQRIPKR